MGTGSESIGKYCTGLVLRFDATHGRIQDSWDKKPMFVSDVKTAYGPNGMIPSRVGLYLAHDHPEQISGNSIYSVPAKRGFKGIACGIDREFREFTHGAGCELCNGLNPSVVEGALQIMESVPSDQGESSLPLSIPNIVLNDLVSKLRINLNGADITLLQQADLSIQPVDVMLGPFNF
jgi:hypothetical protein